MNHVNTIIPKNRSMLQDSDTDLGLLHRCREPDSINQVFWSAQINERQQPRASCVTAHLHADFEIKHV